MFFSYVSLCLLCVVGWVSVCLLTCIESENVYIYIHVPWNSRPLSDSSGADMSCQSVCSRRSNATWLLPKDTEQSICALLILCYLSRASCALEEDWCLAGWCGKLTVGLSVRWVSMSDLGLLNAGCPLHTFRWLLFAFGVLDFAQVCGHIAVRRATWVTTVQQRIVFTWVGMDVFN